jgi:TusA-related sulfurtransferase|tara:strand:+ start:60 stop:314 length:255 start_codon:yes stop_codon:yes gene_type:complete
MIFRIEAIIGDRYESTDSLTKEQVHQWLEKIQKHDILKVETEDDYWEDIPDELFELLKTNIDAEKYDYTMAKGHLWLNVDIPIE